MAEQHEEKAQPIEYDEDSLARQLACLLEETASIADGPDIELRDEDGKVVAVLQVKAPPASESPDDVLARIRERNRSAGERLDSVKRRLKLA